MAAAVLCVALGHAWARGRLEAGDPLLGWLCAAVFFGLYSAHLMDTYIDGVKRADVTPDSYPLLFRDSSGYLPPRAYPVSIAVAGGLCVAAAWVPVAAGGAVVAVPLAIGLALALAYAPLLDRRLLGVSFGYPLGAVAALTAGYAAAAGTLDARWAVLAAPVFVALVGTKVRADTIDLADDTRVGKRTVAVVAGPRVAVALGYALTVAGLSAAATLPWVVRAPLLFALPPAVAAGVVALTVRMDAFRGSMAMAGSLFGLLAAEVAVLALS
jgi:4-hydroxybenzoate polyprenyltransferase